VTGASSLRWRLLLGAAVLITVAVAGTGLVLSQLFRWHVTEQYATELVNHLDHLTSLLQLDAAGSLTLESGPSDPRFHAPYGGRYWQVERAGQQPLRSRSLWDQSLTLEQDRLATGELHRHEVDVPGVGRVLVLERLVRFAESPDEAVRVATALPTGEIDAVVRRFDRLLAVALGLLAVSLLAASALQVTVGLLPLNHLGRALGKVRAGAASRLEDGFPVEIHPLIDELNTLLEEQERTVARARAQAGDLAHGLKTSLQLLLLEADRLDAAAGRGCGVREQVTRMQTLIEHQLARARAQSRHQSRGPGVAVAPSVAALRRVLDPLAARREVAIAAAVPPTHRFAGDAADLEEMLGNLLDNACKWARSRVRIASRVEGGRLRILVEDDGPGLGETQRAAVFARGKRLDERVPGTGLALQLRLGSPI
jgi:signal transduction histidine kinase